MFSEGAKVSKGRLYFGMAMMFMFGTVNTVVLKFQDNLHVNGKSYNHPFFQCACMFLGELLCFFFYFATRNKEKEQKEQVESGLLPGFRWIIFAVPATCDVCGSTLMFIGLTMVDASVYQMMRGLIVAICAIMAVTILRKKLMRHHWMGVGLIVIGIALVGVAAVYMSNSGSNNKDPVLGIIFLLFSQLFTGLLMISEEKFLSKYYIPPMQAVGLEGLWGCSIYIILLPIMYYVPCHVENVCNNGVIEDSVAALHQVFASTNLLIAVIGGILSIAFFNFFGVTTTKNASATARSTIDTSRTLAVWIFTMAVGWQDFLYLQAIGFFLFLVPGTLIYNEVLKMPFLRNSDSRDSALTDVDDDKRALLKGSYQGSSPTALYDSSKYNAEEDVE